MTTPPSALTTGLDDASCPACGRGLPETSDACTSCGWDAAQAASTADPGAAVSLPPRSLIREEDRERDQGLAILLGYSIAGAVGFVVVNEVRSARTPGGWQPSWAEALGALVAMAVFGAWLHLRKRR